jgi:uncharacterized delta-60 repeat protein
VALGSAGDLDPTFDTDGRVTTVFASGSVANAVAVQPNGRIVVVGAAAGPSLLASSRWPGTSPTARSTRPPTEMGWPRRRSAGVGSDEARSVAIQSNGKIVVAGTDSRMRFAVARYLIDGSLDPAFGNGGIVTTDISLRDDIGFDVAIHANGRIVVAGTSSVGFSFARYRTDGTLDATFGGEASSPFGERDRSRAGRAARRQDRCDGIRRAGIGGGATGPRWPTGSFLRR